MGKIVAAEPVVLFCGLISATPSFLDRVCAVLTETFGPLSYQTSPIPFDFTEYYQEEMGGGLLRSFVAFQHFVDPADLAEIKIRTDVIEKQFAHQGRRQVNIDPGYVDLSKVVLASTKDFAHRVYLGQGIYAEVTLQWKRQDGFENCPWTYPDYKTNYAKRFFFDLRNYYRQTIKEERRSELQTGKENEP